MKTDIEALQRIIDSIIPHNTGDTRLYLSYRGRVVYLNDYNSTVALEPKELNGASIGRIARGWWKWVS